MYRSYKQDIHRDNLITHDIVHFHSGIVLKIEEKMI